MATTRYNAPSMSRVQKKDEDEALRRKTVKKALDRDEAQKANLKGMDRAEDLRHIRKIQQMDAELAMEEAIMKGQQNKVIKNKQREQEEALARELERVKLEHTRDDKMRQQIRETSVELRELEGQLKSAYMNKERLAQLAEKEALKYDQMARESELVTDMKRENERAKDADKQKEIEHYEAEVRYQQELERQLEEQEMKKQQDYEDSLKEKLMIDEVVRKIYEEDQRERERIQQKRELERNYVREFNAQREVWKSKEKENLEEENATIARFASLQKDRELARQAAKKEQDAFKAGVQKDLSEKIAAARREFEEMEQVRTELHHEEQEERERQKELNAEIKRKHDMEELQRVYKEQLHFKKLREESEFNDKEEFRRQMMAKFAEDDRIEQMNAQKRRMKQLEHKKAVEQLLVDRQEQFAREREADIQARKDEIDLEAFRKRIIEEERSRLLAEHAPKLLGYLPKGVIRNTGDLEQLGDDYKQAYRPREMDPDDYTYYPPN